MGRVLPSNKDVNALTDTLLKAAGEFSGDTRKHFEGCMDVYMNDDSVHTGSGIDDMPDDLIAVMKGAPDAVQVLFATSIALFIRTKQTQAFTAGFKAGMEVSDE